jgi:hypothetical protein
MADHFDEGTPAVSSPAPPPRAVPIRLRCQLLTGGATVWGCIIFGFAAVLAFGLVSGIDPLGSLRLALRRQEAPGRVLSERDTNYEEDDSTVRRHDYVFSLPNGTLLRGHSYSHGHRYVDVPTAGGDPDSQRWSRVTVEYDPGHPETNRIKGTQTHIISHWVGCMLIFPAGALLAVVIGLIGGWSRIRLLRHGELAWATVTGCASPTSAESPQDVPAAQCLRLLAERAYEFRLPGGEVVRARDAVPADALGDAEAPLPALYNPKWPTDSLLLAALSPQVPASLQGGWETTAGVWPLLRMAVAMLALAGAPLLGLAVAVS